MREISFKTTRKPNKELASRIFQDMLAQVRVEFENVGGTGAAVRQTSRRSAFMFCFGRFGHIAFGVLTVLLNFSTAGATLVT